MGIGIVGKPAGVRLVTGSVHYGKLRNEERNLDTREFPIKRNGRSVMVLGQRIKQERVVIHPVVVEPVAVVKKTRKPARKSVATA